MQRTKKATILGFFRMDFVKFSTNWQPGILFFEWEFIEHIIGIIDTYQGPIGGFIINKGRKYFCSAIIEKHYNLLHAGLLNSEKQILIILKRKLNKNYNRIYC